MSDFEDHPSKKSKAESTLDQLKSMTVVVADTGEVSTIQKFSPQGWSHQFIPCLEK